MRPAPPTAAVVAAAAVGGAGRIGEGHAAAALCDVLAALPVPHQAAGGERDGLHLVGFQLLCNLGAGTVVGHGADALHGVLRHGFLLDDALGVEVAQVDVLHF